MRTEYRRAAAARKANFAALARVAAIGASILGVLGDK
jgi:hypothetical protein